MLPKQPFYAAICCFLFGKETDREKKEQALVFPHTYTQELHPQPEKGNVQYMPTLVCLEKRWGEKSKLEETRKCKRVIWGKTWEDVHRWMGNVTTNPCSNLFWKSRCMGNFLMCAWSVVSASRLIYTLLPVEYHSLLSIWLQTRATIRNLGLCTLQAIYSLCFALSQTKSISIKTTTVLKKSLHRWRSKGKR